MPAFYDTCRRGPTFKHDYFPKRISKNNIPAREAGVPLVHLFGRKLIGVDSQRSIGTPCVRIMV